MNTDTTVGITVGEVKGLRADFEEKLASENGREWLEGFKLFLKKKNPWEVITEGAEVIIEKTARLLKIIGEFVFPATAEKATADCFTNTKRYYYRDSDLDRWLPKNQRAGVEGSVTAYQLEKELTFKEIAQAFLGIDEANLDDIAKALIAGGHTVVLTQIETLIERTEAGEKTELLTNGYGNFFFVEDNKGRVSVVRVRRYDVRQWCVGVGGLDDVDRWRVVHRFFSRN